MEPSEKAKPTTETTDQENEKRPNRGLEDWEMLQTREEPPLKIPFWLVIVVIALLGVAVLLSFPLTGVRAGFERPWLDWGLLVGVAYAAGAFVLIYLFMRKRSKSATDEENDKPTG